MSTVGFDIGNKNSVAAVAQRGGIDVVLNEVSSRLTPTVVALGESRRFVGDAAVAQQFTNLKNTVGNFKRLLGLKWSDPKLQRELQWIIGPRVVQLPDDRVGIEVTYKHNKIVLTPEQLMAMQIQHLKHIVERDVKAKVAEAVLSVPPYFDDHQRRALLDACRIAQLNCLRIINDTTAIALNWGLYKPNLPEGDQPPLCAMFLDMGESHFSAAVVHFWKDRLKVVGSASDDSIGGRNFDLILANFFADDFKAKKGIDLRQYPKSWLRLLTQCARVKTVLNTNPLASISVECIYEEYDLNSSITRDQYNALVQPLCTQTLETIKAVLAQASCQPQDLAAVEIVGSGLRVTALQQTISSFLGVSLSTTMNAEEAVVKGCALNAAMLSPKFKVKEYGVTDIQVNGITLSWHTLDDPSDTKESQLEVFKPLSTTPAPKYVTFNRQEGKPFEITAKYTDSSVSHTPVLGVFKVYSIPKPKNSDVAEVRVKVKLGLDGTIVAETAELVERYEEEEIVTVTPPANDAMDVDKKEESKDQPTDSANKPNDTPAPETQTQGADSAQAPAPDAAQTQAPAQAQAPAQPVVEKRKKKKVKYTPVALSATYTGGLPEATIKEFIKQEEAFIQDVNAAIAVADAKNAVESYVYNTRGKLVEQWKEVCTEEERAKLQAELDKAEDWLYNEGADETVEAYNQKLAELKALGDPIQARYQELEARRRAEAEAAAAPKEAPAETPAADAGANQQNPDAMDTSETPSNADAPAQNTAEADAMDTK